MYKREREEELVLPSHSLRKLFPKPDVDAFCFTHSNSATALGLLLLPREAEILTTSRLKSLGADSCEQRTSWFA